MTICKITGLDDHATTLRIEQLEDNFPHYASSTGMDMEMDFWLAYEARRDAYVQREMKAEGFFK